MARSLGQHVIEKGGSGVANFTFGAIFIAFLIYITAKGELGSYLQMFFYQAPNTSGAGTASNAATNAQGSAVQGALPGTPGISENPFSGLPLSLNDFIYGTGNANVSSPSVTQQGTSNFQNAISGLTNYFAPKSTTTTTTPKAN